MRHGMRWTLAAIGLAGAVAGGLGWAGGGPSTGHAADPGAPATTPALDRLPRILPLPSDGVLATASDAIRRALDATADPETRRRLREEGAARQAQRAPAPTLRLPHGPKEPFAVHPSPEAPPGGLAHLEALLAWLRDQEGVAGVRVPGGMGEGVRAYGLLTSYPAQVPVHVDLYLDGPEPRGVRTCTLMLELTDRAEVRFVDFHEAPTD